MIEVYSDKLYKICWKEKCYIEYLSNFLKSMPLRLKKKKEKRKKEKKMESHEIFYKKVPGKHVRRNLYVNFQLY